MVTILATRNLIVEESLILSSFFQIGLKFILYGLLSSKQAKIKLKEKKVGWRTGSGSTWYWYHTVLYILIKNLQNPTLTATSNFDACITLVSNHKGWIWNMAVVQLQGQYCIGTILCCNTDFLLFWTWLINIFVWINYIIAKTKY